MRSSAKCKMFESKLTNGQLICIKKMISEKRLTSFKKNIINDTTKGRSSELKDLFVNEATEVIRLLKTIRHGEKYQPVLEISEETV